MQIRSFQKGDIQPLKEILNATGMFRPEEIEVAIELMEIVTGEAHKKEDYILYTAIDETERVVGYYCAGLTPMTAGTFDLYWIAVDPGIHRQGVGKQLLRHCEAYVKSHEGKLIVVETSSQPKYDSTCAFYERSGYVEEARIKEYYGANDDLVIYTKHL